VISVGLTGNIGCGKSTVARMFGELGAEVVDADAVVHELLAPGGAAVPQVLARFPSCAGSDGGVDRARLGALVFAEPEERERLEAILHPLVLERTQQLVAQAQAAGRQMVVVEAALIFEAAERHPRSLERFDAVVVVTCDPEVQLQRAMARTGRRRDEVEAALAPRLAAQMPQDEKAARADHVIDNSGDPEGTRRQVRMVCSKLLAAVCEDS
jgi:dephospho-CoA kinase